MASETVEGLVQSGVVEHAASISAAAAAAKGPARNPRRFAGPVVLLTIERDVLVIKFSLFESRSV